MLLLTRRRDESILIGGTIRITVLNVGSNRVQLAIDAPPDTKIVREELLTRKHNIHPQTHYTHTDTKENA